MRTECTHIRFTNFKKRREGYLCNFMKGSHGIEKLYGGGGRRYGGGGRICQSFVIFTQY